MRRMWIRGFLTLVALAILAACSQSEPTGLDLAPAATQQTSDIYGPLGCLPDGCGVFGTSTLKRNNSGATVNFHSSGLTPGDAVTLWAVVFNYPGACSDPCGPDDIPFSPVGMDADPAVMVSVLRVAGHVVGGSGTANFSGRIKVGDDSEAIQGTPGLLNPAGAEIHPVARTHGPAIPGLVNEQIHTFGGGCAINVCLDVQFAVHAP